MKKIAIIILFFAIGLGIYSFAEFTKTTRRKSIIPDTSNRQTNIQAPKDIPAISVVAKNLEVPWAIAFGPDGRMLVTERPGRVRIISNGIVSEPIVTIPVHSVSESGLHGVAVDPDFRTNKNVYLYYTYSDEGRNTLNRVVRYKFENEKLIEDKIIVDRIPGAPNHDGGRIKFGPDGFLYITTGDAENPSRAQDKNSLAGKILRITTEGNPASGNPFADAQGKPTRVFSYGHRNPQGITWAGSDRLYEVEHGQSATDEFNYIEPGKNYGWPVIRGNQTQSGMESPFLSSGNDTWAPGGAAYYRYPDDLRGSVFFAGLRGQALFEIEFKGDNLRLLTHFKGEYGRLRDVVAGPDNMLYVTTSNRDGRGTPANEDDKILRINPKKLSEL